MDKKNLLVPGAILLGFIVLTAGIIWALSAFSFRVGVVDNTRISSNENQLYKGLNDSVQEKGMELQKRFASAKTDSEKSSISKEFEQYKSDKQKELSSKIQVIVAKIAKRKGLKAVASTQVYIYGDVNLTDDVLKECNK